MKKVLVLLSLAAAAACGSQARAPKPVTTEEQKTLHAIGLVVAKNLEIFQLNDEEFERVLDGVRAARAKKELVKVDEFQAKIGELARARMAGDFNKRKEADARALKALAADPKAEKADSGMVYIPIKEGTGPSPKLTERVKVHYTGKLVDGTEFDSSVKRGQPITFPLDQVIPCWTQGVSKMKVGGKATLLCPSEIAYGNEGRPPVIPGGASLIFEVELLGIEGPSAGPPPLPGAKPAKPAK